MLVLQAAYSPTVSSMRLLKDASRMAHERNFDRVTYVRTVRTRPRTMTIQNDSHGYTLIFFSVYGFGERVV